MKRQLKCCVCGADAGRWHQHDNRDKGWGICKRCVVWIKVDRARPEELAEFDKCYGKAGVNYEDPWA